MSTPDSTTPSAALQVFTFRTVPLYTWYNNPIGPMVGTTRIVEHLGLNAQAQQRRIQRNPLFADCQGVAIASTPGGLQHVHGLSIFMLPTFLVTINASRVQKEKREELLIFQKECALVLGKYWYHNQPEITPPPSVTEAIAATRQALIQQFTEIEHARAQYRVDYEYRERELINTIRELRGLPPLTAFVPTVPMPQKFFLQEIQTHDPKYIPYEEMCQHGLSLTECPLCYQQGL